MCHDADGKGRHTGGAPLDKVRDLDAVIASVTNGRNNMPPFRAARGGTVLEDIGPHAR